MLRFWLVCFGLLFVLVELWQWLQELTLPLPFCILGGIALAIASNFNFSKTRPNNEQISSLNLPPDSNNQS
ncbi:hypothetical protein FRE64_01325 [Euhalothece natronophila Z-M001]|uniref:Uncharacterized protein n=1 Tax=Euhalothece natronophila Z-M001 TaxID=522448 RepID=A0A5B8NJL6_9CHRO|nr:hypothetical protein [Euhalothece natronophila]QDZ38701.1 hypothetical protein FRE64_01325 [Euhalothece natronophila Z-M001]